MDGDKTSSFKRKPLSDCTNTVASTRRKPPENPKPPKSSIAHLQNPKPPKSSIAHLENPKPPKSSVSIAPNQIPKPSKSSISIANPPKSSVSIAATQTNSSKSSISIATATATAGSDERDHRRSGLLVSQSQRQDAETRMDKGKMAVETPIIQISEPFTRQTVPLSSSAASDERDHRRSGLPVSRSQRQDAETRMDKGKMAVETPIIQISEPFTRQTVSLSSSAASGSCHLPKPDAIQSKNPDAQPQKDKGKMAFGSSGIQASDPTTAHAALLVSSSSALDDRDHRIGGLPVSQSQRKDAKTRMDKGKMAVETPIIQISKPFTPRALQLSSSPASRNCHLSDPDAIQSKDTVARPQKDKGKMVLEAPSVEASDPGTPHAALLVSSSSASDVQDQERTDSLTVYSQRRSPRRRCVGETIMPFSCPPRKRTKLKGVEYQDDQQYGSHTDPVPQKKNRSRNKKDAAVHGMPQDEIERLKSYYADIDAFELPEEVASEDDLD